MTIAVVDKIANTIKSKPFTEVISLLNDYFLAIHFFFANY